MDKVTVAVPTAKFRGGRIGVFILGTGVVTVDLPAGHQKGDEFQFDLNDAKTQPKFCAHQQIACPHGMTPGDVFQHRLPSGKTIPIMCPPFDAKLQTYENGLLIPAEGDRANKHFIIQAQMAPPEEQKEPAMVATRRANEAELMRRTMEASRITVNPSQHAEQELQRVLMKSKREEEEAAEEERRMLLAIENSQRDMAEERLAMESAIRESERALQQAKEREVLLPPPQMAIDAEARMRIEFLDSLPPELRLEVLQNETLHERALRH